MGRNRAMVDSDSECKSDTSDESDQETNESKPTTTEPKEKRRKINQDKLKSAKVNWKDKRTLKTWITKNEGHHEPEMFSCNYICDKNETFDATSTIKNKFITFMQSLNTISNNVISFVI